MLGFSGECQNPVSEHLDFTSDLNRLSRFINGLQPGSGTPIAEAILVANRFIRATIAGLVQPPSDAATNFLHSSLNLVPLVASPRIRRASAFSAMMFA